MNKEALVEAWLRSAESGFEDDESLWAFELIGPFAARQDPNFLWDVVTTLVGRAKSKRMLGLIGAGPLEALTVHHGTAVLGRIAERAGVDDRFLYALLNVWGDEQDVVFQRVRAIRIDALRGRDPDHMEIQLLNH